MAAGIYAIRNKTNGKQYIGQSISVEGRCEGHLRKLQRGTHYNEYLQRAFGKYGKDAFEIIVLEVVEDLEMLTPREQYYLDTLRPEYNMCPVAGSCRGRILTEEHRRKISVANRRRLYSDETRHKISEAAKKRYRQGVPNPMFGKTRSKETRHKLSEAQKRYWAARKGESRSRGPFSDEHRRNISIAAKKREARRRAAKREEEGNQCH